MSLLEFFYDGRKLFLALILTLLLLIFYFVFQIEIIPYNVFIILFSNYLEELNPISLLIFYYFIVNYIFSIIIIGIYDLIKKRSKNA